MTKIGTRIILGSLLFDGDWYQQEYPDVAAASLDPVRHYFDNGSREGRNPNRYFDTNWYASNNSDVAAAGLNPFLHYLLYGAREGRRPGSLSHRRRSLFCGIAYGRSGYFKKTNGWPSRRACGRGLA